MSSVEKRRVAGVAEARGIPTLVARIMLRGESNVITEKVFDGKSMVELVESSAGFGMVLVWGMVVPYPGLWRRNFLQERYSYGGGRVWYGTYVWYSIRNDMVVQPCRKRRLLPFPLLVAVLKTTTSTEHLAPYIPTACWWYHTIPYLLSPFWQHKIINLPSSPLLLVPRSSLAYSAPYFVPSDVQRCCSESPPCPRPRRPLLLVHHPTRQPVSFVVLPKAK